MMHMCPDQNPADRKPTDMGSNRDANRDSNDRDPIMPGHRR